jgi:hypothetical protein
MLPSASSAGVARRRASQRLCGMLRTQTAARSRKNSRTFQDEAQSQPLSRDASPKPRKNPRPHRRKMDQEPKKEIKNAPPRQPPAERGPATTVDRHRGRVASRVKLSSSSRQSFAPSPRASPPSSPIPSPVRLLCRLYAACSCCALPRCRALDRGVPRTHTAARKDQEPDKFPRNQRVPTARAEEARSRGGRKEELTSRKQTNKQ